MADLNYIISILLLLTGILAACLVFSNAIENLGEKLKLGNQITGSILAAIGTALPETIVPMVAIYLAASSGTGVTEKHGIAIGSILGAPFLLGTLAFFLMGMSIIINKKKRGTTNVIVNIPHVQRDLLFFIVAFSLALIASVLGGVYKIAIVVLLGLSYASYLVKTITAHDEFAVCTDTGIAEPGETPELYATRLKLPDNIVSVILQTLAGLIGIIFLAEIFVGELEHAAAHWSIDPLILSLVITPIATELPEKINSVIWSSQGKDTLAMGNITGAMVFQSSIPCAIGILFTPWHLSFMPALCGALALASAIILLLITQTKRKLEAKNLLLVGSLYIVYLIAIFNY
jgi:cation:H+ antiporter